MHLLNGEPAGGGGRGKIFCPGDKQRLDRVWTYRCNISILKEIMFCRLLVFLFEVLFFAGGTSGIDSLRDFLTFHMLWGQSVSCPFFESIEFHAKLQHAASAHFGAQSHQGSATQSDWTFFLFLIVLLR